MSLTYRTMYRLGFIPWEHRQPPSQLVELIEGPHALPPGDMLDIGCGTGHYAIYAARHGWTVTGVDVVAHALDTARHYADQAHADICFLHADIANIATADLGTGYTFLLDVGCLHGLPDEPLKRAIATITEAAEPGATLLMLAFTRAYRGPAPRGIDPARIPELFAQWDLAASRSISGVTPRGAVRRAGPTWYRLIRQ